MQHPVGMEFNPDTMRNEMVDFWAVLMNPVAVNKFLHTVISSYIVASLFVAGVSAWPPSEPCGVVTNLQDKLL